MIHFKRYPHVKDLIVYYATNMNELTVLSVLEHGLKSEEEATRFAQFVWTMVEQIGVDNENETNVLGSLDNTNTMPDIDYEVSLYLANFGYSEIWEQIFDDQ